MLSKNQRLKGRKKFLLIYKYGKVITNNLLTLIYLERNDDKAAKIGFVISKKISKKACIRNKLKRQLRYIYKNYFINQLINLDIICIAKKNIVDSNFLDIKHSFCELLNKITKKLK